jgi:hypothetical protein
MGSTHVTARRRLGKPWRPLLPLLLLLLLLRRRLWRRPAKSRELKRAQLVAQLHHLLLQQFDAGTALHVAAGAHTSRSNAARPHGAAAGAGAGTCACACACAGAGATRAAALSAVRLVPDDNVGNSHQPLLLCRAAGQREKKFARRRRGGATCVVIGAGICGVGGTSRRGRVLVRAGSGLKVRACASLALFVRVRAAACEAHAVQLFSQEGGGGRRRAGALRGAASVEAWR